MSAFVLTALNRPFGIYHGNDVYPRIANVKDVCNDEDTICAKGTVSRTKRVWYCGHGES